MHDFLAAMLSPDSTPEQIAELGQIAEENDLPDTPDEDTAPINHAKAPDLREWIEERAIAKARANRKSE